MVKSKYQGLLTRNDFRLVLLCQDLSAPSYIIFHQEKLKQQEAIILVTSIFVSFHTPLCVM